MLRAFFAKVLIVLSLLCSALFAVVPVDPMISLTSPEGGAVYHTGESINISWNSLYKDVDTYRNQSFPIRIELILNGRPHLLIADSLNDVGSYSWKIPDTLNYGTTYSIQIRAYGLSYGYSSSSAFTINCPKQMYFKCQQDTTIITQKLAHIFFDDRIRFDWITKGEIERNYTIAIKNINATEWTLLKENHTYNSYELIVADSIQGSYQLKVTTTSDTFSAISNLVTIIPTPKRIEFPHTIYTARPEFCWHSVEGISHYLIEVIHSSNYDTCIISDTTSDTTFIPDFNLIEGTYHWRVQPLTVYCDKLTSNLKMGSYMYIELSTPQLIDHTQNPTRNRRTTFSWHALVSESVYTFILSQDSLFSSVLSTVSTSDTFFTPSEDLPLGPVFWKVKVVQTEKTSRTKKLIIAPDTIPLLKTIDPVVSEIAKPVLRWEPVTGAIYYKVEIYRKPVLAKRTDAVTLEPVLIHSEIIQDTFFTPPHHLQTGSYECRVSSDKDYEAFSYPETFTVVAPTKALTSPTVNKRDIRFTIHNNSLTAVSLPKNDRVRISVFSIDGKLVLEKRITTAENMDALKISDLRIKSGLYIVQISTRDQVVSGKYILK